MDCLFEGHNKKLTTKGTKLNSKVTYVYFVFCGKKKLKIKFIACSNQNLESLDWIIHPFLIGLIGDIIKF